MEGNRSKGSLFTWQPKRLKKRGRTHIKKRWLDVFIVSGFEEWREFVQEIDQKYMRLFLFRCSFWGAAALFLLFSA
jgi:hypothetical protein